MTLSKVHLKVETSGTPIPVQVRLRVVYSLTVVTEAGTLADDTSYGRSGVKGVKPGNFSSLEQQNLKEKSSIAAFEVYNLITSTTTKFIR